MKLTSHRWRNSVHVLQTACFYGFLWFPPYPDYNTAAAGDEFSFLLPTRGSQDQKAASRTRTSTPGFGYPLQSTLTHAPLCYDWLQKSRLLRYDWTRLSRSRARGGVGVGKRKKLTKTTPTLNLPAPDWPEPQDVENIYMSYG